MATPGSKFMTYRVRVVPKKKRRKMQQGKTTKKRPAVQVIESCLTWPLVKERIFCDLPKSVLAELDEISSPSTYPRGAILFVAGQEPRGVFVICNGRVKLSASSSYGKSILVRVAEAGEMVGLPGCISGKPYELTAEALEPLQANFIPRKAFLHFLRQRGEAAVRIAKILSHIYHTTLSEVRYLALSASTAEKLARFLLDLPGDPTQDKGQIRATLTLTHKEIAEMIGASRETVTRLFASFKRKRLVEVRGPILIIANKAALERLLDA
ncbi:MAG: Crp/Fnr family transcriptional regulator [Acidobacteria bacterium]|nr:MAG: Crp/Fnr family transcriptional regulator [Acidobacteriota bacterium]